MAKTKHKFLLRDNATNDSDTELATCSDVMTANYLADFYKGIYDGNEVKLQVVYKYGRNETIMADYKK